MCCITVILKSLACLQNAAILSKKRFYLNQAAES